VGFDGELGQGRLAVAMPRRVAPLVRQLAGDPLGVGRAARSARSEQLVPRTKTADRVVQSICPYCAVGCAQGVYVKDEKVIQIEGDPDSPISPGGLCPKGAASEKLVNYPMRKTHVKYRRAGGATNFQQDVQNSDCILIMGSNMAERG
jgi:formate dehydrogenase major subunit